MDSDKGQTWNSVANYIKGVASAILVEKFRHRHDSRVANIYILITGQESLDGEERMISVNL